MSDIVSHDIRSILTNSKQPRKVPLTRTKPVDSFSDLCQQLTNVVAHQTALSEKLIEAFRETKDSQNNLQIPYMENSRHSPIPETLENLNRQTSMVSFGSFEDEEIHIKTVGMESLNSIVSNIDTIRTCNYAALNQLRAILTGQVQQDNLQVTLTQIFSMLSLINTQCGVCKTGLIDVERKLIDPKTINISNAANESKYTQTASTEVDTGESDADDKDSGLESNSGRISETGVSLEEFQLYTEYDELMQAPMPEDINDEIKRRPSFLKDKKNSCPTHLLERKMKPPKLTLESVKQTSLNESPESVLSSPAKSENSEVKRDDTIIQSLNNSEVFSPASESVETLSVQSLGVSVVGDNKDIKVRRSPKLCKLQRAQTICNPTSYKHRIYSEDDELMSLNITQSSGENEKEVESDFVNLESQVNIIKFNYSTNSFTCKGRKSSLQSLVIGTRKQISSEMNEIITKLTSNKRRKITIEEIIFVEEMAKSLYDRIDQLMQLSQQFGAILHETTHSDEKEILINFIDMVKALHRPTSIPVTGAISFTFQGTDSVVSSGENDRRAASPTPGRYTFKTLETNYENGFNEGIDYMKCTFQTEMQTSSGNLDKLLRASNNVDSFLTSEMEIKNKSILGYGAYIVVILVISVILRLFV